MLKFFQSVWGAVTLGLLSFAATFFLLWSQVEQPKPKPAPTTEKKASGASFALQGNPEIDLLITDLQRRKAELDEREKHLNELATRLQAESAELSQLTQEVARIQTAFDDKVTRIADEEAANLKKLAKTYAAMSPENAARILKELDDTTVVKILTYTKEEETARILESLSKLGAAEAKRVATLSEKLRLSLHRSPAEKPKS